MDPDKNATEAGTATIAPQAEMSTENDAEARFQQLETEKENYRQAYLKEVDKNKDRTSSGEELDEDERMTRIAQKALADSRLAEIAREQDAIIKKALKENKELKLVQLNKTTTTPPAGMGTHGETTPVRDGTLSPDQEKYLREVKNFNDKDIERYKGNLRRRV